VHVVVLARTRAGVWWRRERLAPWLPPVSRDNEELQIYLRRQGWPRDR